MGRRLEATGMATGCRRGPGGQSLPEVVMAGLVGTMSRRRRALSRPRASLAAQEHGLLQAGGEWSEGWALLPRTRAAGHP